jgi:hypothetical protein
MQLVFIEFCDFAFLASYEFLTGDDCYWTKIFYKILISQKSRLLQLLIRWELVYKGLLSSVNLWISLCLKLKFKTGNLLELAISYRYLPLPFIIFSLKYSITFCSPTLVNLCPFYSVEVLFFRWSTKKIGFLSFHFRFTDTLIAGHGSQAVWGMYCLRSVGGRDHGFESHSGHGCLMCVCVCVVLCLGRGFATSRSPVQGVLPSVNDQETEKSALCSQMRAKRKEKKIHL